MPKKRPLTIFLILLTRVFLFSQEHAADANRGAPFSLNLTLDSSLIASAVGLNGAVLYFDKIREVSHTDFDGIIPDSSQVNGFDRLFMNPYSEGIDDLGTCLGIASVLAPSVLLAAPSDEWLTIGTMYAETMTLAYGIKELGKLCVSRPRPFMYYDDFPRDAVKDNDWDKSFPSGHTTLSFAGATFASYVFCEYFPDSKWKIPVIASSYFASFGTAACRVASGDHFVTDVIVGAIAGSACGYLVPWMHSRIIGTGGATDEKSMDITLQAMPASFVMSLKY